MARFGTTSPASFALSSGAAGGEAVGEVAAGEARAVRAGFARRGRCGRDRRRGSSRRAPDALGHLGDRGWMGIRFSFAVRLRSPSASAARCPSPSPQGGGEQCSIRLRRASLQRSRPSAGRSSPSMSANQPRGDVESLAALDARELDGAERAAALLVVADDARPRRSSPQSTATCDHARGSAGRSSALAAAERAK